MRARWRAAGGQTIQISQRGRPEGVAANAWEDLTGTFLPGAAPPGWMAIVRPDRTVLTDGPADDAAALVQRALALLGTQTARAAATMPTAVGAQAA